MWAPWMSGASALGAVVWLESRENSLASSRTDALRPLIPDLVFDRTIARSGHNDIYARSDFHAAMRGALAAVISFQQRARVVAVERARLLEQAFEVVRERLVAARQHVEEIADRDQVTELEVVTAGDKQQQHHLQGGALALQRGGRCDQRRHERRAEGVGQPELIAISDVGLQHFQNVRA